MIVNVSVFVPKVAPFASVSVTVKLKLVPAATFALGLSVKSISTGTEILLISSVPLLIREPVGSRLTDWPFAVLIRDSKLNAVFAETPVGEFRVIVAETGVAITVLDDVGEIESE